MDQFKTLINQYFEMDFLHAPLFYRAKYGLRFEIGNPSLDISSYKYRDNAYLKSLVLLKEIFEPDDKMMLIVNQLPGWTHDKVDQGIEDYITNNELLSYRSIDIYKNVYDETDSDGQIRQSIYPCRLKDVNYQSLLKAIINQDLGLKPCIYDEVYFYHIEKKIIYYLYDDRGLDVASSNKQSIEDLYLNYKDWLLDFDKEKMEALFIDE